ncbi:MAG: AI-2E family transporter [Hyphomicrobiales bacterium]
MLLKQPAIVRLAPRSSFEAALAGGSRVATIIVGLVVFFAAIDYAQVILAPVTLAIVLGLMFGPLADRIERLGIPPSISAALAVAVFAAIIATAIAGFAVPLSDWLDKLPMIWSRLQAEIVGWRGVIASIDGLKEQLQNAMGQGSNVTVAVSEGSPVAEVVYLAPAIAAQMLIFLASFYFYIATRAQLRIGVLSLCFSRRLRWRVAHVFRDVEFLVSRYLLSITAVNFGLGAAVTLALWLVGVPSPLLWGLLAGVLNYVIYIGPAFMVVILLGVGLATGHGLVPILTPAAAYLMLHLIEAQFVTPHVIGRAVTLNPLPSSLRWRCGSGCGARSAASLPFRASSSPSRSSATSCRSAHLMPESAAPIRTVCSCPAKRFQ